MVPSALTTLTRIVHTLYLHIAVPAWEHSTQAGAEPAPVNAPIPTQS